MTKLFSTTLVLLLGLNTWAGEKVGNGGDICESRIQAIRDDINTWIAHGGSATLKLPKGILLDQYNVGMQGQFAKAKIACIDQEIFIGEAEKTCKNDQGADGLPFIQCNTVRFMATSESDQYMLVHHEYAGLAGFEINNSEASDYSISSQITGSLEDQVIKKLVVRSSYAPSGRAKAYQGTEGEVVTVIPLNNNTKILIYAHNTYGMNDEKVLVYDLHGDFSQPEAGYPNTRGNKSGFFLVLYYLSGQLEYLDTLTTTPYIKVRDIKLQYSPELSEKIDVQDLLKRAQDFIFQ